MSLFGSLGVKEKLVGNIHTLNKVEGYSAYELAVKNGFKGTEREWLNSLKGDSAYDLAVKNGYNGKEREWIESLEGDSAYEVAVKDGYTGTVKEWLNSLKGETGTLESHTGIDALGHRVMNVAKPEKNTDAVNKMYLTDDLGLKVDSMSWGYYAEYNVETDEFVRDEGVDSINYAVNKYGNMINLYYVGSIAVTGENIKLFEPRYVHEPKEDMVIPAIRTDETGVLTNVLVRFQDHSFVVNIPEGTPPSVVLFNTTYVSKSSAPY